MKPSAEEIFKEICLTLMRDGVHPTPTTINLHRFVSRSFWTNDKRYSIFPSNRLNGRECKWLREVVSKKADCMAICCAGKKFGEMR